MIRAFSIGVAGLFSVVLAGSAIAQERQVMQEGYSGIGTGRIGSGPGAGIDNEWMRNLLARPEGIFGRVAAVDLAAGKIYLETGGQAYLSIRINERSNQENLKALRVGQDVEVQAYRNTRRLGSGAFASEVPEGDPIMLNVSVLREPVAPTALLPQAGFQPDTDRALNSRNDSLMGGVGGQCFQCYEGAEPDYKIEESAAPAPSHGGGH